jgi:hypothetical protein
VPVPPAQALGQAEAAGRSPSFSLPAEHIGTKTAVQIRSHAQKFFTKVV